MIGCWKNVFDFACLHHSSSPFNSLQSTVTHSQYADDPLWLLINNISADSLDLRLPHPGENSGKWHKTAVAKKHDFLAWHSKMPF